MSFYIDLFLSERLASIHDCVTHMGNVTVFELLQPGPFLTKQGSPETSAGCLKPPGTSISTLKPSNGKVQLPMEISSLK